MKDSSLHIKKPSFFSKNAWRYYAKFFNGQYGKLIWASFGSAFQAVLIIPVIFIIKYSFDTILPGKEIKLLIYACVAIFILRLINSLLSIWLRNIHIRIINASIFKLRNDLFLKLFSLPRSFFTGHDPKVLHTRIVVDTERLANMSNAIISRIFPALILSVALTILLFFFSWKLTLVILLLVPVLFVVNRIAGKILKKRVFIFQRAFETFSKGAFFIIRYMDLSVIQSTQKKEIDRQSRMLEDLKEKTDQMALLYSVNSNLQDIITGFIGIVIIMLGGFAVINQIMTLGDFISFYIAAGYLNKFVNTLTGSIPEIISGNESLNTLTELAEMDDDLPYQGRKIIDFNGSINLKNVHFKYSEQLVLENVDLEILPHKTYAIIGPNSGGKTTLVNLILGFYKPSQGSLNADGVAYADIDLTELRKSFGVIMQHPQFFSGTIKENILYGSEDKNEEVLIRSAKMACADSFINNLPQKYDTEIGEDGVLLSGGERQRIAIARALVRNPRLLILDEPTNHLENGIVSQIISNMESIEPRPSILIISHDMELVNFAQKIYLLENKILRPVIKK